MSEPSNIPTYPPGTQPPNLETMPNPPDIGKGGKNKRKAISSPEQAYAVVKQLEWAARMQIQSRAAAQRKIDGEPPFDTARLKQAGKSYRSNTSFRKLSTWTKRVAPRFYMRTKLSRYLTAAALPAVLNGKRVMGHTQKTEVFREVFTRTARKWRGFNRFIQLLAWETCAYGYCFPIFLDRVGWKPDLWRLDQGFVPEGTPCMSQDFPFFGGRQNYDAYELAEKIEDRDAAKEAGWDIPNTVEALNAAAPIPRNTTGLQVDARRYEDVVKELIPGESFQDAKNVVPAYLLFCREYDGGVTQYMLHRDTGKVLFEKENIVRDMSELVLPFVFQLNPHLTPTPSIPLSRKKQIPISDRDESCKSDYIEFLSA